MSETRKNKRLKASALVNKLINYDVISFDIFDTLILRNVSDPKDIFAFLATKYSLLDFAKIRVEEERKLREKKREIYGNHEVTIREIYDKIYKFTSINPEIGVRNELEEEKNFCYANPYMKIVFDTLIQNGKKVIITSDMYLPHDLMAELLESCGYVGYDKLFVSCDYYCNKRNLGLYEYIKNNYLEDDETVIHVGDNQQTDYINAKKSGWDAYHYPQNRQIGKPLDRIGMSYMIASYYTSIVNNFLYNGLNEKDPYDKMPYYYGFVYGGLLVLGYVNWIHEKAIKNKMDKIIFLARDGYILKKIYDMLYDDIPSEYALWSRQASMKTSLKVNLEAYIWQFITRRKGISPDVSIESLLKDMEFDVLINKLHEKELLSEMSIGEEGVEEKLIELILENVENINEGFTKYSITAKEYFKELINGSSNVGIVDIGWRGTGAMSLKYLFENEWEFKCSVKALVSGTYKIYRNRDANFYLNKDVECYMFSGHHNSDLLFKQQKGKIIKSIVIELFTSATFPSFAKFDNENDLSKHSFDVPEIENYDVVNLTLKGEIDFVKEYIKHIKNHPELLNISGRDAYLPMDYLMQGKRFEKFKKTYSEITYNRLIGGLKFEEGKSFETFGEICKKNGRGKR